MSRVQPITNENSVVEGKLFPNRIYKTIKVKGLTLAAIIDIGSDVCIINQDVFNMLNGLEFLNEKRSFIGIGEKKITTLGCFDIEISLDRINIPIRMHVARTEDILYPAIIGNDVFHFVHMSIGKDGAHFKKIETQTDDVETNKPDIKVDDFNNAVRQIMNMQIDIDDNKDLVVSHLESDKANKIIDLIEQYSPKKQESFPVEVKIVLKDDTPISHRLR